MTRMAPGTDGRPRAALWDGDAGYHDGDADRPGPRRRLWHRRGQLAYRVHGLTSVAMVAEPCLALRSDS